MCCPLNFSNNNFSRGGEEDEKEIPRTIHTDHNRFDSLRNI